MKRSSAYLLLGLCHLGSAAALGLGDISVRSHLGQPLHAVVNVLGAPTELDTDCFRIDPAGEGIAAPTRVQLRIERSGAQTLLHIRTSQAMNDPVAQFVLAAECETRLQREYVVLLDPPALAPDLSTETPSAEAQPGVGTPGATAMASARPRPATLPSAHPVATTPRKPAIKSKSGSTPRLILSGRHRLAAESDPRFSLKLDTSLPDPAQASADALTATELSDENTALTRKLAHLEAQLAALHKRNAELEAQRAAMTAPPPMPAAPQWPLYLLAIGLVGSAAGLVAWMRRRRHAQPDTVLPDVLGWTPPGDAPPEQGDAMPTTDSLHAAPTRIADVPPPPAQDEGTEVKEDILDQAEVFMAHGHGDLAVHLLQEHLREAPTESPVPWLLLLDLLHRAGDTAGYAAASTECRRYFNVNLSGHPISQDGNEPGLGLEAYPHLLEKLVHVWNTPEINAFFEDLIYDKRGGTRVGFEPGAYRDILLLRDIAHQALPLAA